MSPSLLSARLAAAVLFVALALPLSAPLIGQGQPGAMDLPDAVEAIDHARVVTRILCITAHPDDEPAALLSYLARGLHADVALMSITRGEGGQNALGPEQGLQLAALRSQELLSATRIYGIRLFFTRARDTGFVKTVEVTKSIWGDTALADMVHVIRTFQPNIVINSWGGVHSGHGHHQTSGILTPVAVAAAGDPKQFAGDLAPWHVDQILVRNFDGAKKGWAAPTDDISPLWGRTYIDIGRDGDLQHRTQGIAGFLTGPVRFRSDLVGADGETPEPAKFAEPLPALAARYPALTAGRAALDRAEHALSEARRAALALDWPAATHHLATAGKEVDAAGASVATSAGALEKEQAAHEIGLVRARIQHALRLAGALQIDTQANRREAIPGESITVRVGERHRERTFDSVSQPRLEVPDGWTAGPSGAAAGLPASEQRFSVDVPAAPRPAKPNDDWMLPQPPPLVRAAVDVSVEGYKFTATAPVTFLRASSTQAETLPLQLVPRVTLALEPRQMLVVPARRGQPLEVVARVHYYGSAAAQVQVGLDAPPAWPAVAPVTLQFDGPGDQLARLQVTAPRDTPAATLPLRAYARVGAQEYRTTVEPLPTLSSWLWSEPAVLTLMMPDLVVPDHLRVGYVAAENDPIPDVLREAGITVDMLDPVALAFNDLSHYDAIAVGIRAYELRADLARSNKRLLDYAAAGGTLVVQYQRATDWNRLLPGPYPAKVGDPTLRVTDRNSPVTVLVPASPLLSFPNKIGPADFQGWVQERGLYFFGDMDAHYTPVLAMRDAGEPDLNGSLVVAPVGKGTYIYTGLSFFRQLPEGVQGPIRLFVNLLSQSRK